MNGRHNCTLGEKVSTAIYQKAISQSISTGDIFGINWALNEARGAFLDRLRLPQWCRHLGAYLEGMAMSTGERAPFVPKRMRSESLHRDPHHLKHISRIVHLWPPFWLIALLHGDLHGAYIVLTTKPGTLRVERVISRYEQEPRLAQAIKALSSPLAENMPVYIRDPGSKEKAKKTEVGR